MKSKQYEADFPTLSEAKVIEHHKAQKAAEDKWNSKNKKAPKITNYASVVTATLPPPFSKQVEILEEDEIDEEALEAVEQQRNSSRVYPGSIEQLKKYIDELDAMDALDQQQKMKRSALVQSFESRENKLKAYLEVEAYLGELETTSYSKLKPKHQHKKICKCSYDFKVKWEALDWNITKQEQSIEIYLEQRERLLFTKEQRDQKYKRFQNIIKTIEKTYDELFYELGRQICSLGVKRACWFHESVYEKVRELLECLECVRIEEDSYDPEN